MMRMTPSAKQNQQRLLDVLGFSQSKPTKWEVDGHLVMRYMARDSRIPEGNSVYLCRCVLAGMYKHLRSETIQSRLRRLIMRMEGGPAYSLTIREIYRRLHNVEIGLYSPVPCGVKPNVFHPGTKIGRHSYIANTVRTFTRNHPLNTRSTHGFFENPALGKVSKDLMVFNNLLIGNGVWIGHNAIILPPTEKIGDGAVVAAGSVVYEDVPPYAVVGGSPAVVIRKRFAPDVIEELLASRWWEDSPAELAARRKKNF